MTGPDELDWLPSTVTTKWLFFILLWSAVILLSTPDPVAFDRLCPSYSPCNAESISSRQQELNRTMPSWITSTPKEDNAPFHNKNIQECLGESNKKPPVLTRCQGPQIPIWLSVCGMCWNHCGPLYFPCCNRGSRVCSDSSTETRVALVSWWLTSGPREVWKKERANLSRGTDIRLGSCTTSH